MKKRQSKKFYDEVFRAEILIEYNDSPVDKSGRIRGSAEVRQEWVSTKRGFKRPRYILTFSRADYYDLAHECIHLIGRIFNDRNIILDTSNSSDQELIAYYQGYWIKKIWEVVRKW